jgi:UDP-N-acetylmuramate: L-alanyl-gamma-D-glutamyl-meso-diaminopimelate ligase
VIDDFAHHPTAVWETLTASRAKFPASRIVAVFEPRSYTAQIKLFQGPFTDALSTADLIVIAGLFHPERYSADVALSPPEMVAHLNQIGRRAAYIPCVDDIVTHLDHELKEGDVVVIMSNGSFGGIHDKLLQRLALKSDE